MRPETTERSATAVADRKLIPVEHLPALLGGISRSQLYVYLRDGSLRTLYLGRRRFATPAAVDEFIRSREAA